MRVEDQYVFTGDVSMDTVYGGAPDNIRAYGKFFARVQRKSGLLPEWWTAETLMECIIFGLQHGDPNWGGLNGAMEKSDVVEYYSDPTMPMQLRKFAEQVLGRRAGGYSSSSMTAMQGLLDASGLDSMHSLVHSLIAGRR